MLDITDKQLASDFTMIPVRRIELRSELSADRPAKAPLPSSLLGSLTVLLAVTAGCVSHEQIAHFIVPDPETGLAAYYRLTVTVTGSEAVQRPLTPADLSDETLDILRGMSPSWLANLDPTPEFHRVRHEIETAVIAQTARLKNHESVRGLYEIERRQTQLRQQIPGLEAKVASIFKEERAKSKNLAIEENRLLDALKQRDDAEAEVDFADVDLRLAEGYLGSAERLVALESHRVRDAEFEKETLRFDDDLRKLLSVGPALSTEQIDGLLRDRGDALAVAEKNRRAARVRRESMSKLYERSKSKSSDSRDRFERIEADARPVRRELEKLELALAVAQQEHSWATNQLKADEASAKKWKRQLAIRANAPGTMDRRVRSLVRLMWLAGLDAADLQRYASTGRVGGRNRVFIFGDAAGQIDGLEQLLTSVTEDTLSIVGTLKHLKNERTADLRRRMRRLRELIELVESGVFSPSETRLLIRLLGPDTTISPIQPEPGS